MDLKPGNRTYPEKLLDGGLPIVRPAEVVDHLEGVIQPGGQKTILIFLY